ncbi:hypothetical protein [Aquella oligotrophica]|nr:hypothetical protein [Aquella oligotrophica]
MNKKNYQRLLLGALLAAATLPSCVPIGGNAGSSPFTPIPTPTPPPIPLVGWQNTSNSLPIVTGRANNIGLASDQLGNLYVAYQGSESLAVYRYVFGQSTTGWQQIASNQNMSLGSASTSIAVDGRFEVNMAYLSQSSTDAKRQVFWLKALPDKIDFSQSAVAQYVEAYSYSGVGTASCPAPEIYDVTTDEMSMALAPGSGYQILAYSDTTKYETKTVQMESGVCTADGYSGGGRLSVFNTNLNTYRSITTGTATQVKVASTPTRIGTAYPVYIAYADGVYGGGVSVLKLSSEGGSWDPVGPENFSNGPVNFISLAVDTTGVPYVAYESSNQLLAVRKYSGNSWVAVGGSTISTHIATWISIAINQADNSPYVAYQESGLIKVRRFDGESWVKVGSDLSNTPNNYGAYNTIVMRQTGYSTWQPAVAFQSSSPTAISSNISTLYYVPSSYSSNSEIYPMTKK